MIDSVSKIDMSDSSPIHVSERTGSDDKGEGTIDSPFKTILKAMHSWGKVRFGWERLFWVVLDKIQGRYSDQIVEKANFQTARAN